MGQQEAAAAVLQGLPRHITAVAGATLEPVIRQSASQVTDGGRRVTLWKVELVSNEEEI